jgi:rare lipoprotein A
MHSIAPKIRYGATSGQPGGIRRASRFLTTSLVSCLVISAGATGREIGKASWYHCVGGYTAAHRTLPLSSYARVMRLDSGSSIIVKINDRGPYIRGRIIDLSPRAAAALNMRRAGVVPVMVEPVRDE